jgi:hypothetical protein
MNKKDSTLLCGLFLTLCNTITSGNSFATPIFGIGVILSRKLIRVLL